MIMKIVKVNFGFGRSLTFTTDKEMHEICGGFGRPTLMFCEFLKKYTNGKEFTYEEICNANVTVISPELLPIINF